MGTHAAQLRSVRCWYSTQLGSKTLGGSHTLTHAFVRGKPYKRQFISDVLGSGLQDYLPHQEGSVTYGAFSLDLNPDAPRIVLPGTGPEIEKWAEVFAEQDGSIPVFIKKRSNEWIYMGRYRCRERVEDDHVIEQHARKTRRNDISIVLFLERDAAGEAPAT